MRVQIPSSAFSADAWILDCDGTLVDSMPAHFEAWKRALATCGATFEFTWELFLSRAGMSMHQTVVELNRQFGTTLDPSAVDSCHERQFFGLLDRLEPISVVVEACQKQRGVCPLVVASGSRRPLVVATLTHLEIADWFEFSICAGEVLRGKPAPDAFLECATRLGVHPGRCVVFEDSPLGIEAAISAGMAWVAVDGTGRASQPES